MGPSTAPSQHTYIHTYIQGQKFEQRGSNPRQTGQKIRQNKHDYDFSTRGMLMQMQIECFVHNINFQYSTNVLKRQLE